MSHEYHIIYSVRCYPQFHVTALGLGTHYPWIRGHTFILICVFFTLFVVDIKSGGMLGDYTLPKGVQNGSLPRSGLLGTGFLEG
jgi:hypothetical protein